MRMAALGGFDARNPVKADSKIPYCVEHLEAQRGKGAPVERSAIRPARSLIAKGA